MSEYPRKKKPTLKKVIICLLLFTTATILLSVALSNWSAYDQATGQSEASIMVGDILAFCFKASNKWCVRKFRQL